MNPLLREDWVAVLDLVTIIFAALFISVKCWQMGDRTREWTRLGAALVASNFVFAVVYWWASAATVWPSIRQIDVVRWGLRVSLIGVLAWGLVELRRLPKPEEGSGWVVAWRRIIQRLP